MRMGMKTALIFLASVSLFAAAMGGLAEAKSLYVINNINQNPTPISSYAIMPDGSLVYQTTTDVPYYGAGAVGITIDTASEILFVTYETSDVIQLLDATTMQDEGTATAPGATNLAGIIVDHENNLVYTMDRYTNHLYVYTWDAPTKTLTLQSDHYLSNVVGAFGVTLDETNDLFYVADGFTTEVRYYNTSDWTEAGYFTVSHLPIDVAVDEQEGYVYTGGSFYGSSLLSRYDLSSNTETLLDLTTLGYSDGIHGVAVDPEVAGSPIYVTTGFTDDRLLAINSDMATLIGDYGDIGDPTGLCIPGAEISYSPLNFDKDDGLEYPIEGVYPGNNITYDLTFDNVDNSYDVHNVVIEDTLPTEVIFVSASGTGTYDPGTHTVTWQVGTIPAGGTGTPEELVVQVDPSVIPGTTVTNFATIDSDETAISTVTHLTMILEPADPPWCDVKVDGSDGPVWLAAGSGNATIDYLVDANSYTGVDCDVCLMKVRFDSSHNYSGVWSYITTPPYYTNGAVAFFTGPLDDMSGTVVASLPVGHFKIVLCVEEQPDGILQRPEIVCWDYVVVHVN